MSPRTQLTTRSSPVADRYLKAVDYGDDPSHSCMMSSTSLSHWNKEEKEETQLSFSGTASLSSSSRTPTPVRGSGRSPWQPRSISRSPKSIPNSTSATREVSMDSSRSPQRILLFPESLPSIGGVGGGVEEGNSTSTILRSGQTAETRSPRWNQQHTREPILSPTTPTNSNGANYPSRNGDAESWRRKLEGTSHGMKRSPIRNGGVAADASWIKKKASPRHIGKQTQQHTRSPNSLAESKPQPLTEEKLRARAQPSRAHPSAAPTEVTMNLSSQRMQTNQKAEVSGGPSESAAPTELMMNLSSQRMQPDQKSDFTGAPTEVVTNRAADLTRRSHHCDDVDERIEYALQQGKRKRQGGTMTVQCTNFGIPERSPQLHRRDNLSHLTYGSEDHSFVPVAQGGRLGRHVGTGVDNVVTNDESFQSKSLTSSVGVEIGGRSIERPPVALQRVLEFSPRGSEALSRGGKRSVHQLVHVRSVAPEEYLAAAAKPNHPKESSGDSVPTASSEEEKMVTNNPLLLQYPTRVPVDHLRHDPQTISPASSGWTPVALSSGGLDPDDFQSGGVRHSRDKGVQPLFSPSRVNSDVMDMMEFGPPMINRKALLDDEVNSITSSSRKTNDGDTQETADLKKLMKVGFIDANPAHLASNSSSYAYLRHQKQATKANRVNFDGSLGEAPVENGAGFDSPLQPAKVVATSGLDIPEQLSSIVVYNSPSTQSSLVRNRIRKLNKKGELGQDYDNNRAISEENVCFEESSSNFHRSGNRNVAQSKRSETAVIDGVPADASHLTRLPSGAKSSSRVRTWDSRSSEVKSRTSSSSTENILSGKQEEGSEVHGHTNSIRLADRYLSSIIAADEQVDPTPVRRNPSDSNSRALPLPTHLPEGVECRTSSHQSFKPSGTNNVGSASSPRMGSVSMMKSLFEPSDCNNNYTLEDDEISDDSVSVKSIRSIFEAEKKVVEQEDSINEVSKIRSMFERQSPPQSRKLKMSANKLPMRSPLGANLVHHNGGRPGNAQTANVQTKKHTAAVYPHHSLGSKQFASQMQAATSEATLRSSSIGSINADGLVYKEPLCGHQPTIADRIVAMKLERSHSEKGEHSPAYGSSPALMPMKSPRHLGISPRTHNFGQVVSSKKPKEGEQAGNHHGHPLPTSSPMSNRDLARPFALASRSKTSAPMHTRNDVDPFPIEANVKNAPIGSNRSTTGNGNAMTRFRQATSQPLIPDNPALSRWGVTSGGNQEVYEPEKQGHRSSLQGVMGRKTINEEPRYLDASYRTDSEGYDDGVTLDLSIAEVSQLTNPTCLHSKEGGSFEGASSRASNADGVEQEGRGPSEASSSQTSEAAAPLIALAMRARYTNSSDDYGNFAQKSFVERLASGAQSKWVPLTAPIEENDGGGPDPNADSSDPAWDLRNIKARFVKRQTEREITAKQKTPETKSAGSGLKVWDQSELDGWEPFKTEQFQASFGDDASQEDAVEIGRAQNEPRLVEKRARKGPVDPPPTLSANAKVGGARDASPTAVRVNKSTPRAKSDSPAPKTPYSQQAVLMSKLRSLKEARIRRNTTFLRKVPTARSNRAGMSRPPSGFVSTREGNNVSSRQQSPTQYSEMRRGGNAEEEEHSISTMSSTKFGGEKFNGCLDLD